eukprot:jgi/Orpsp1_1/1182574/evm.model.c7180000081862.1
MLKFSFLFALLITFAFANLVDYTKSAKRTFNEIEGRVPKISAEIDPEEYERFKRIAQIDQENDIVVGCNLDASCLEQFETKATLTYELDGEKKVFKKVTFKAGGNFGRANDRVGFNMKLKGDDLLFDRKQIRVRPDAGDASHLKSKIAYDLLNIWGLPSIQETYCEFYLNGEYFGLYVLQDSLKASWIKKTYGLPEDEEVETLYYCKKDGVNLAIGDECVNQNDNAGNYTEPFEEFLQKIDGAKSVEDLEKFMNVDLLMKNLAIEFLFGSFDHYVIQGHNFYVYQRKDGIWDLILVDFDNEFGGALMVFLNFVLGYNIENFGYNLKFEDMPKPGKKLLDPAYFNDKDHAHFKKALRELMITGFNPDALFRRIDELKAFIAPYVEKTTTPREDGRLPGVVNFKGSDTTHTMADFEAATGLEPTSPFTPTIKGWIKNRFEFACEQYGFDQNEILKAAAEYRGEKYFAPSEEIETVTITTTVYEVETEVVDGENDGAAEEITDAENNEDSADEVDASVADEEDSAEDVDAS